MSATRRGQGWLLKVDKNRTKKKCQSFSSGDRNEENQQEVSREPEFQCREIGLKQKKTPNILYHPLKAYFSAT